MAGTSRSAQSRDGRAAAAVLYRMRARRVLFGLIVCLLAMDASGLEGLFLPEACASVADRAADNDCPPTCARCACAQPIVASPVTVVMVATVYESIIGPMSSALLLGAH